MLKILKTGRFWFYAAYLFSVYRILNYVLSDKFDHILTENIFFERVFVVVLLGFIFVCSFFKDDEDGSPVDIFMLLIILLVFGLYALIFIAKLVNFLGSIF